MAPWAEVMLAIAWARMMPGLKSAPISGMVPAATQIDAQAEIDDAARAQEQRRPFGRDARAVGGEKEIGGEKLAMAGAKLAQARRTHFLSRLDQELGVEAEPAARAQHGGERAHIDAVLPLVVGGAATIEAFASLLEPPGRELVDPLSLQATNDVAMPVSQYRGRRTLFLPFGEEQRPSTRGVGEEAAVEPQQLQAWPHLPFEIRHERLGALRVLTLGRNGDAASEIADEAAIVEIRLGGGNSGIAAHWRTSGCAVRDLPHPAPGRQSLSWRERDGPWCAGSRTADRSPGSSPPRRARLRRWTSRCHGRASALRGG